MNYFVISMFIVCRIVNIYTSVLFYFNTFLFHIFLCSNYCGLNIVQGIQLLYYVFTFSVCDRGGFLAGYTFNYFPKYVYV